MTRGARATSKLVHHATPVVRSQGQAMLLQVTGSLAAIGLELSATAQSVHEWRIGRKKPSPAAATRIETAFGIPRRAWNVAPGADAALHSAAVAVTDVAAWEGVDEPPASTLEHCRQLLSTIRRERMQAGLLSSERVKLASAEAQILALQARLEQAAELSEDRYVREHPAYQRLRAALIAALVPHPAAAQAVAAALAKLDL